MANQRRSPSGWLYVLGGRDHLRRLHGTDGRRVRERLRLGRVDASDEGAGTQQFDLAVGSHTMFYESRSVIGGEAVVNPGPGSLSCGALDPAGEVIALQEPSGSKSYGVGSFSGKSALEFTVATAGRHTVQCDLEIAGVAEPIGAIAIGGGFSAVAVAITIVSVLVGLSLGLVVILWTYRRRKRGRAASP